MKYSGLIFGCSIDLYYRWPGSYRIASFLRENNWDIEIIDYAMFWTIEELKEITKSRITSDTKFIGFSTVWISWYYEFYLFVLWLKEKYPDILLIVGGPSAQTINCEAIDYYVRGYGEKSLLTLFEHHFSNSTEQLKFDPEWEKSGKKLIQPEYYPSYPMKSLMVTYEDRDYIQPWEWMTTETSRGCIFKCKFCNFPILGVKEDYSRTAEDYELNLKINFDQYGIKNYFLSDETFNDSIPKMEKFAQVIERLPFTPYFSGYVRADLLVSRPEDRELLLRNNVIGQYYGIESTNPASVKIVGKGMHPDKLLPGLKNAKNYFKKNGYYRGSISLIVGLPYETLDTLNNTFNWMEENWNSEAIIFHPLYIMKNDKMDRLSEISKDPAKYGYTILPEEVNDTYLIGINQPSMWKNDHFDFNSAIFHAREFSLKTIKSKFHCDSFEMIKYSIIKDDIDFMLNQYNTLDPNFLSQKYKKHIEDYKIKKFNT